MKPHTSGRKPNLGIRLVIEAYQDPFPEQPTLLESILAAWSLREAKSDVDCALEPAADAPGYLRRTVANFEVYVSANLARVSPSDAHLKEIIPISQEFKFCGQDDICLSGSATFFGRTEAIDDIDFAEYFIEPRETTKQHFDAFIGRKRQPSSIVRSVEIRLPRTPSIKESSSPFSRCRFAMDQVWRQIFLECCGVFGHLGEFDVSNKIFPANKGMTVSNTFVYQEIVIRRIGDITPRRPLSSAEQVAGYLNMLESLAIKEIKNRRHLKALKRVLSALLLLQLTNYIEEGLGLLPNDRNAEIDRAAIGNFVAKGISKINEIKAIAGSTKRSME